MAELEKNFLKKLKAQGASVADAAQILGVSRSTVYNKISGTTPWRKSEMVMMIHTYGLEVADFKWVKGRPLPQRRKR